MKEWILTILIIIFASTASASAECSSLRETGISEENIDLLLVGGENYENESSMAEDFQYYVGTDNRGLFDVYPMNTVVDRFNIWYIQGREGSSTESGSRGPFREARYWRDRCGMDYSVFLAKESHDGWRGAALDKVARVDGVAGKVDNKNGAVGLIHEWGHLFGNVADEYNYGSGKRSATTPNCARNMSQARNWWGEMAEVSDEVGFERGCKGSENIEPHPGKSIMGDGGLWSYGPVNDRQILERITEETKPVTDIAVENNVEGQKYVYADVSWENASHVVTVSTPKSEKKFFTHKTGIKKVKLAKPEMREFEVTVDTGKDIEEVSSVNNVKRVKLDMEENYSLLNSVIRFLKSILQLN